LHFFVHLPYITYSFRSSFTGLATQAIALAVISCIRTIVVVTAEQALSQSPASSFTGVGVRPQASQAYYRFAKQIDPPAPMSGCG